MVILEARRLTVGYAEPVVRSVDFELAAGEVLVVLGPNGAGKSTLLRTLAGLLRPLEGSVAVAGVNVHSAPRSVVARLVGYVPQEARGRPLLTVLEYLVMARLAPRRGAVRVREEDLAAAEWALELLGASSLAGRRLGELSGGQRQLVEIARALVVEPKVLIMDEPTSALDVARTVRVAGIVRRLAAEGIAVIIATHDFNFALDVGDWCMVLHAGSVAAFGEPSRVIDPELVGRVYGVEAARVAVDGWPRIVVKPPRVHLNLPRGARGGGARRVGVGGEELLGGESRDIR